MEGDKNAGRPVGSEGKARVINEAELELVIKSIRDSKLSSNIDHNITLIYFNYFLGLKGVELCGLKIFDVFDGNKIRGSIHIVKPKKTWVVPLNNPKLKIALDLYIKSRIAKESDRFSIDSDLFKSQKGSYSPESLNRVINTIYKSSGLSDVTGHSGKLSFIKNRVKYGYSLEQIYCMTGDVSINTTRLYMDHKV